MDAGLVSGVEDWQFSEGSLLKENSYMTCHYFSRSIVRFEHSIEDWLNGAMELKDLEKIRRAAKRTEFRFSRQNESRLFLF